MENHKGTVTERRDGDTLARRPSYARRSGLREGGSAPTGRHRDAETGKLHRVII